MNGSALHCTLLAFAVKYDNNIFYMVLNRSDTLFKPATGHVEVVKLLLRKGAFCDPSTFQGERCLNGALNHNLRSLMLFNKDRPKDITAEPFVDFFGGLLKSARTTYYDVQIVVPPYPVKPAMSMPQDDYLQDWSNTKPVSFKLHKCVMAARSRYFSDMLAGQWRGKRTIVMEPNTIHPRCFRAIVKWLYNGELMAVPMPILGNLMSFCVMRKMTQLSRKFYNAATSTDVRLLEHDRQVSTWALQKNWAAFVHDRILPPFRLRAKLQSDADETFDRGLSNLSKGCELPFSMLYRQISYADLILHVGEAFIPVHRAFLLKRCPFFEILLDPRTVRHMKIRQPSPRSQRRHPKSPTRRVN